MRIFPHAFLILTTLSILISGCSDSKGHKDDGGAPELPNMWTPPKPKPNDKPLNENETPAQRIANEFTLTCEVSDHCPLSTGALFLSDATGEGFCTNFVAGEYDGKTVIGTNKHCIESIQDPANQLYFRFPATDGLPEEHAYGSQILAQSPFVVSDENHKSKLTPDYAFVQLDRKINRAPLRTTQRGIEQKSKISVFAAKRIGFRAIEMKTLTCSTTSRDTAMAPFYRSPYGATIGVFGCKVVSGMSGSPVVKESGEVGAILMAGFGDTDTEKLFKGIDQVDLSKLDLSVLGVATNLACFEVPTANLSHSANESDCKITPENFDQKRAQYRAEAEKSEREMAKLKIIRAILKGTLDFLHRFPKTLFGWDAALIEDKNTPKYRNLKDQKALSIFELRPECVFNSLESDENLAVYRKTSYGFLTRWDDQGDYPIVLPSWYMSVQVTEEGSMETNLTQFQREVVYQFSPLALSKLTEETSATVVEKSVQSGWVSEYSVKACAPDQRELDRKADVAFSKALETGRDDVLLAEVKRQHEESEKRKRDKGK